MIKSESITQLAQALSIAQGHIRPAEMNKTNPFLKNRYADLGSIIAAAREPLAANGLAFSQVLLGGEGGVLTIETILMHKSGEYISSAVSVPIPSEGKGRSASQEAGAVITYFRRYALASLLGIYADEDTDGGGDEKATSKTEQQSKKPAPPEKPKNEISLETAEAVTSSKGQRYGDLDSETLSHMATSIRKSIAKNGLTGDEKDEHQYKLDAILTILQARNSQPA